jgi:hypothetical protein
VVSQVDPHLEHSGRFWTLFWALWTLLDPILSALEACGPPWCLQKLSIKKIYSLKLEYMKSKEFFINRHYFPRLKERKMSHVGRCAPSGVFSPASGVHIFSKLI